MTIILRALGLRFLIHKFFTLFSLPNDVSWLEKQQGRPSVESLAHSQWHGLRDTGKETLKVDLRLGDVTGTELEQKSCRA